MQLFELNGVTLAYVDHPPTVEDRHEPVLLVHGFASSYAVNWANTLWTRTLTHDGRRVIGFDNRGHGASTKLHHPSSYGLARMAGDALALMDHLGIAAADVMGYSMGARITAYLAAEHPGRVRSAVLGGLGMRLVDPFSRYALIAQAMDAPSLEALSDPTQRMFRAFAEANGSDLAALSACMRGMQERLTREEASAIRVPVLVASGTKDDIAEGYRDLAGLIPGAEVLDIPGRNHNLAVGDKVYKAGVLDFLRRRP